MSLIWPHREREPCRGGPWSTKFLGFWPVSVEQFAIGTQEHVTVYWTVHQPAEDRDICAELLRYSVYVGGVA